MIRAAVRAIGAEHTLALRAAEKAASRHRRNAAEVRAMYVSAREPQPENDVVEKMKADR